MKVTAMFLHLPPYLSTSWSHIRAIYLNNSNGALVVDLTSGITLAIPGLSKEDLDTIFAGYAAFLEAHTHSHHNNHQQTQPQPQQEASQNSSPLLNSPSDRANAIRFNLEGMGTISSAMQHDSSQSNNPNIPDEILNKIAQVAKIVAPDELQNTPKPEPHCNCTHCQIARAIHGEAPLFNEENHEQQNIIASEPPIDANEEIVTDKDLSFQEWEITQLNDKLYTVTNRLDTNEKYNVFLGEPIGCTCGRAGCEHILSVLNS